MQLICWYSREVDKLQNKWKDSCINYILDSILLFQSKNIY